MPYYLPENHNAETRSNEKPDYTRLDLHSPVNHKLEFDF
jgi:hypothetical protein